MYDNMDLTEKYFNAMFDNVNTNMTNLNDKLDKVIASVDRIDGKVVEHGVRITFIEQAQRDHIDKHSELDKKKDSTKQFTVSQAVAVLLVILAILSDHFL